MKLLKVLLALLFLSFYTPFLTSCGGGGGGGETSSGETGGGTGGGETGGENSNNIVPYIGYYTEDPATNPEDPTAGFIFVCLPDGDGQFTGQFLFSYQGCQGGIDLGNINGTKTNNNLSGNWSGTVDGTQIHGTFDGSNTGSDIYSGTWNNSNGKVHIQVGTCEYYVAPNGDWTVYGTNGNDVTVSGANTSTPTFSWNPVTDATVYLVSVYEKESICSNSGGFENSLMWQALTTQTSIVYGSNNPPNIIEIVPEKPLESGKTYVVTVIAAGNSTSFGTISDVKEFLRATFQH